MSNRHLEVNPSRASTAKIANAAQGLEQKGSIAVLPTDTNYVLACSVGDKAAIEKIRKLRMLENGHAMTLTLSGFASLGKYAVVDNIHFRMLKSMIPGPYTFILQATKEVPRVFSHPKRKTVGIRIPEQQQLLDFVGGLHSPVVTTTLKAPGSDEPITDLEDSIEWLRKFATVTLNVGPLPGGKTTIVDLSGKEPEVVREGVGDVTFLTSD